VGIEEGQAHVGRTWVRRIGDAVAETDVETAVKLLQELGVGEEDLVVIAVGWGCFGNGG